MALYPFLRSFPALAQTGGASAGRLVFFFKFHGWDRLSFFPANFGALTPGSLDTTTMNGFDAVRDDVLFLRGLDVIPYGNGNGHTTGCQAVLTGSGLSDGQRTSVDRFLANELEKSGYGNSQALCFGPAMGGNLETEVSRNNGVASPIIGSMAEAYNLLFGNYTFSTAGNPAPAPQSPSAPVRDNALSQIGAALDLGAQDAKALKARLPADLRPRLDAHLEMLSSLRDEVVPGSNTKNPTVAPKARIVAAQCTAKSLADFNAETSAENPGGKTFERDFRVAVKMLALAIACDRRRIFVLQSPQLGKLHDYMTLPSSIGIENDYHDACHKGRPVQRFHDTWMNNAVAELAVALRGVDVPAGGRLLDSTAIVTISDAGNGSHDLSDYPFAIIGGRNMGVKGGRYVRVNTAMTNGKSHTRLLTSLVRMMGRAHGIPALTNHAHYGREEFKGATSQIDAEILG
jgi:hypothetical protein